MKNSKYMSFDFDLINGNPMNRIDYPYLEIIDFQNKLKDSNFPLYCGKEISPNASVGKMPTYFDDNGTVYCVRSENLKNGKVDLKSVQKKTNLDTYKNEPIGSKLGKGDFLMVSAGSCGKFAIYDENEKCLTNEAITHLDINTSIVNKEFLLLCVNSNVIQEQINKMKTTAAIPNFKYQHFKKLIFPIMSLEEQERTLPLVKAKIKILEDKIKELEKAKEDNSLQKVSTTVIVENYDNSYESTQDETKFLFSNFEDMYNYLSFNNISHKEISTIEKVPLSYILEKGSDTKIKTNSNSQYIVGLEDIESFTGKIIPNKALDNGNINSDKVIFKGNDIMFAKMRPYLGKFIVVNKQNQDYIGSSELFGLKIKEGVDVRLVKIILSSNYIIDQYKQYYSGNGKPRISRDNLLKVLVPKSVIDDSENFVEEVAMRLDVNMFFDEEIAQLQSIIDNDLNKYILNGYSDDLFEIPKEGDE